MKTHLLLFAILIASIQCLSAAEITRNVNISFLHTSADIDIDGDGDTEIHIDGTQELGLPGVVSGPPCDYTTYSQQVLVSGSGMGTRTNDVTNVSSIASMIQMTVVITNYTQKQHLGLGDYSSILSQSSGSCYPYTPYYYDYVGFLTDTSHTTNTFFSFYVNLNGTNHYGFLVFDGYHVVNIVYEDAPDTGVDGSRFMTTLSTNSSVENGIKIESNENGMISISTEATVQKVMLTDLNGRSEEYHSASFHTNKKGWVVVQITTTSGVEERRRIFIQ